MKKTVSPEIDRITTQMIHLIVLNEYLLVIINSLVE